MYIGGCTKYIQPGDVWNRSFKAHVSAEYAKWMAIAAETAGLDETVRRPNFDTMCSWINAAWKSVSKETIYRSFQCCGLTTSLDVFEDHQLYCFKKPDLSDGLRLLAQARAGLNPANIGDAVQDHDLVLPAVDYEFDEEQNNDDILIDGENDLAIGAQEV